ncbi:thiol:disulfide interchange protein DsbG [Pseudoxanthomonas kaohsiungensis]|uniref:Thiol:disulfide interchange protein n=1 Tax=Pseudoxanthomonas kaohsiungensis TaxID=283923 RepID=A0ABW3LXG3_9GAMM|nr:thiol:disulfide interchange protein DsbG [Pseudoxanthomonas kaohsiungensis]KAF1702926.1 thiol:disulfide interchange protein DsbG [Pseudoxanthomonas kaohsiungensis]
MRSLKATKLVVLLLSTAAVVGLAGCGRDSAGPGAEATGTTVVTAPAPPDSTDQPEGAVAPTAAERFLLEQGSTITTAFTSESGLKAIVAERGTEQRLFYVTADGGYLISGTVYDAKGGNVTNNDLARAAIPADSGRHVIDAEMAAIWEQAGGLDYVAEGAAEDPEKIVYVIFDPQCPYCHQLWGMIRPVAAAGRIQVRWIPVAILSESSKNLAAAIYQAKDASRALTEMGGGTLTGVKVTEKTAAELERNLQLLQASGYTGVPTILYMDDGRPRGIMSVPGEEQFNRIFR